MAYCYQQKSRETSQVYSREATERSNEGTKKHIWNAFSRIPQTNLKITQ